MQPVNHASKNKALPLRPNVVGIVDCPRAIQIAARLPAGSIDLLEWRADCFSPGIPLPRAKFPWLVTARHPSEGGRGNLSTAARREMLLSHLGLASAVDIEARSLDAMRDVADEARRSGVRVIASFHDFKKTPTAARLKMIARRAIDSGADILKVATVTKSPGDIARLLALFTGHPIPVAVMGMGPLGMSSRVLFASCGSVLNYGWLDRPNVPGQWSAVELKRLLKRIGV